MKRLNWKYLAGFIDGEGCIDLQVSHGKYIQPRIRIGLAASSKFIIDMLKNSYGGSIHHRKSANADWQDAYTWQLNGYKNVCKFLRNIINHLFIKKEQARLILWMERNLKGRYLSQECRSIARQELKLMKRDPHRLSVKAQENILEILQSSEQASS